MNEDVAMFGQISKSLGYLGCSNHLHDAKQQHCSNDEARSQGLTSAIGVRNMLSSCFVKPQGAQGTAQCFRLSQGVLELLGHRVRF